MREKLQHPCPAPPGMSRVLGRTNRAAVRAASCALHCPSGTGRHLCAPLLVGVPHWGVCLGGKLPRKPSVWR